MEENEQELGEAFEKAVKTLVRQLAIVDGVVISVDQTAYTCDVQVGDSLGNTIYHDVTLRVLKGSQASVIEIPKVGSACTIYFMDGNLGRPKILMVDQTQTLFISCPQVTFNGGKLGGMVKVIDLVDRLNTIEEDINNLKSVFSGWTPVPNDGGAALKAASTSWSGEHLTETQRADIEDGTITH